jgi:hypothetical protein
VLRGIPQTIPQRLENSIGKDTQKRQTLQSYLPDGGLIIIYGVKVLKYIEVENLLAKAKDLSNFVLTATIAVSHKPIKHEALIQHH